ncbi:hypothetical protein ElyMa_004800400 [Elysia marginata]|uniref:Uncharacterized protein n=1 Tax=Elysia marginata TaxID=1093978 RepID=A0AAV4IJI4_9GAST|nr:hypothetical protein ElyMa_004800400 [Elysia marginata]
MKAKQKCGLARPRVDLETARQFVRNLTQVLKLPPGLIYQMRVDPDGAITLMLNPDPEGVWDTEKLAKDAKAANDKLKAMGGITVQSSGFGQYNLLHQPPSIHLKLKKETCGVLSKSA